MEKGIEILIKDHNNNATDRIVLDEEECETLRKLCSDRVMSLRVGIRYALNIALGLLGKD